MLKYGDSQKISKVVDPKDAPAAPKADQPIRREGYSVTDEQAAVKRFTDIIEKVSSPDHKPSTGE